MNADTDKRLETNWPEEDYDKKRPTDSERKRKALKWWVGTVVLTLFPLITTIIVAALREDTQITWDLVLNDGELVLSSFLIVTSTLISCNNVKKKSMLTDIILYMLFGTDFFQLIAYTVFKTNSENNLTVVGVVSLVSLLVSIFTSWTWYNLTSEGG